MIKGGQINKGMCLIMKGNPYLVVEREFVNPGKGAAFSRCKLKNLKDGSVLKETIKSNDNVEEADVYDKNAQYMYADGEHLHFMDNSNYDQFEISAEYFSEKISYLKEGDSYKIVYWETEAIDLILPMKMVFIVTEAPEAIKGDTVTGATKMVTTETGLQVRCPIFIKEGEKIMVNTETGEYVERVNS